MLQLIRHLLNLLVKGSPSISSNTQPPAAANRQGLSVASDAYFLLHEKIETAARKGDISAVTTAVRATIPLFGPLVRETKDRFGQWDIQKAVAVETGGRILAVAGEEALLRQMHGVLASIPELGDWAKQVEDQLEDARLAKGILSKVRETPGILQTALKEETGVMDGHRIASICYWLDRVGSLKRVKAGRSYALYSPDVSRVNNREHR